MIPLFKTHFSIGKSILTIEDIFEIQENSDLNKIVVVEDCFYGFRTLNKTALEKQIPLIFGLRLSVVQAALDELPSKLIFFARNNSGIKQIKQLYSKAFQDHSGILIFNSVGPHELSDVSIFVPFYDSFIYNNLFHFGLCHIDLSKYKAEYLLENNNHPFDKMISEQVVSICKTLNQQPIKSKSIYYKNREDFDAFQMYKAICNRSGGKNCVFSNPNLIHFSSNEFCWESFQQQLNTNAAV